ncbi:hypothetical protein [Roseimicrobium gellanilyticum]|uniref:hypothetical protein n=1 Tax=Roseimicrobium gellanilyticum TaxID=748857 RepID=UPI0011BDF616|nr:hypothetical protein [Roseimicrobium gellanilyticum]
MLTFIAHAGVGDSFPVQEEGKPKDFDVIVKSGDDDKLVLEFSQDGKPAFAPITLGRDWTPAQSGNVKTPQFQYEFKYPSVSVSGKAKTVTDKAMIIVRRIPLNYAFSTATEKGTRLYTVRFDGTEIQTLRDALRYAFPGDNVVLSPSAEQQVLPGFEVRNVRLSELARTIEFLSEGRLMVEMVEKDAEMPGNIWRISGNRPTSATKGEVKMRAVATPHLFADEKVAAKIELDVLRELEHLRLDTAVSASVAAHGTMTRGNSTSVQRLTSQKVFVLVGSEEGVDGLESFLKAAELRAAEEAATKKALATAAVPKMRAVAAPHVFQNASRLDKVRKAAEEMISLRATLVRAVAQSYGVIEDLGIGAQLESRPEQKLFVLFGPEDMLDGMESFILAAEKLAVDEDALAETQRNKDKP